MCLALNLMSVTFHNCLYCSAHLAPAAVEPFQTLAMVYEDRNDWDKFFEVGVQLVV